MSEMKQNISELINNLDKLMNPEDQLRDAEKNEEPQCYDSQRSSTSTSSMNEINDNLGINSKSTLNFQNLDENHNQRKFFYTHEPLVPVEYFLHGLGHQFFYS